MDEKIRMLNDKEVELNEKEMQLNVKETELSKRKREIELMDAYNDYLKGRIQSFEDRKNVSDRIIEELKYDINWQKKDKDWIQNLYDANKVTIRNLEIENNQFIGRIQKLESENRNLLLSKQLGKRTLDYQTNSVLLGRAKLPRNNRNMNDSEGIGRNGSKEQNGTPTHNNNTVHVSSKSPLERNDNHTENKIPLTEIESFFGTTADVTTGPSINKHVLVIGMVLHRGLSKS